MCVRTRPDVRTDAGTRSYEVAHVYIYVQFAPVLGSFLLASRGGSRGGAPDWWVKVKDLHYDFFGVKRLHLVIVVFPSLVGTRTPWGALR